MACGAGESFFTLDQPEGLDSLISRGNAPRYTRHAFSL